MNISEFARSAMNDILATNITDATPGFGAAVKVLKDGYNQLVAHQNLITYSTADILHSCPRKYQI